MLSFRVIANVYIVAERHVHVTSLVESLAFAHICSIVKVDFMIRRTCLALFDAAWAPVFLVVATTWLYAPWLRHVHAGHLDVISVYEATGQPYAALFRVFDVASVALIVLVVWRVRLLRRHPWLTGMLLLVAALMVVDDVFVTGCSQQCSTWLRLSRHVHDTESAISVFVLAAATAVDAWRNKAFLSQCFLAVQVVAGVAAAALYSNHQAFVLVQYGYQILVTGWLAYVLRRFMPPWRRGVSPKMVRGLFAGLVVVSGLLELLLAFHVHSYGDFPGKIFAHGEPVWLAQHGVLAGVSLLYIARYVYVGERRAAILVGAFCSRNY